MRNITPTSNMKTSMIQPIPGEQAERIPGRCLKPCKAGDAPDLLMLDSSLCDFEKVLKAGLWKI